ncbi:DUF1289 domain-containing protein [Shewanella sp. JM162201]|uniref:DUF1289 domain-containing protein n=1 Tax=Shewanella jiangmenensis TaxID=2837387 RepID=A0ABS5V1V6_9GAMM|nr:DUF1289 domain-containing protein [Shewanella jiangmenensis]MBT1443614.1 DUF1289 domain-containing protein [Shewanella jiangmenensis]
MEQLVFFEIPSPCINVCQSDNRGFCLGCFRSRDERFNWQQMSDAQKMETIRLCRDRKKRRAYAAFKAKQEAEKAERASMNGSLPLDDAPPTLDLGDFSLD